MGPVKDGKRAEDQSLWFKSAYLAEKYKVLIYLIVMFLLAFGFDFKTPAQAMKVMQVQIDSLKNTRDLVTVRQGFIMRDLKDLKYLVCLDHPKQAACQPEPGR